MVYVFLRRPGRFFSVCAPLNSRIRSLSPKSVYSFAKRSVNVTEFHRSNPEQYPIVHHLMRRALVKKFPYEVLYEIENGEIII